MQQHLFENLVHVRRQIHANPELGYEEFDTTELIANELSKMKIPFRKNIAKTGVIAEIKKGEGACVVLRADIDALPIKEDTGLSFSSNKTGSNNQPLMHACGHDLHTTILLGAIHLLKEKEFNGTIKFIFQPSEEGTYDDKEKQSGGQKITESGELENVKFALGLHVHPTLPVGKLAFVPGQALANVNFFNIKITGEPAHAGLEPEKGKDAIVIAAQLIQQAQLIVSRLTPQTESVVISFTQINGGLNQNILAPEVNLTGTVRALDLGIYNIIIDKLQKLIDGLSSIYDVEIKMEIGLYYPSLLNDISVHKNLDESLNNVFGNGNVIEAKPVLGGEDFAFYSRKVASMFYFLGARDTSEKVYSLHHPKVIFNEECIPFGVNLFVEGALKLLQ